MSMARTRMGIALAAAGATAFIPLLMSGTAAEAAQPNLHRLHAAKAGSFSFRRLATGNTGPQGAQAPPHQPMNKTLQHTTAAQVPNVPGTAVSNTTGGAVGFNGLDNYQQVNAGTGIYANSQLDSTPPDMGLCVGQGDVLQAVNDALRVYSTGGTPLTAAVPLNQFLGVAPEAQTNPDGSITYGPFLSDPKCYYDPDTKHWFMSVLEIALDPSTGAFGNSSLQYLAVSQTADPTRGWNIYSFPTTDDGTSGTPADPGCPCFGDQPLLGADANGLYITTNEYNMAGSVFNGAQLYALSKTGLETGANLTVTHLQPGSDPSITNTLGGVAFSIQPATSPNSGYETAANGTEYFQSALDFGAAPALGTRADQIAVWSLTNTKSLKAASPAPVLHVVVVGSEEYTQPPNAAQAPGTLFINNSLPLLDANDDRMNQVVYAGGHLWSGLNTAVKTPQGSTLAGTAWFVTTPSTDSTGQLSATLAGQGYLAINKENVLFPSIGVTPAGKAVMAFTVTGPDFHPSAGWAPLSLSSGTGPIYLAAPGQAAFDDFSAAKAYAGNGSARWGGYSAAVSDPAGNIWMGVEYISGVERTALSNWATFISHVTP